MSDQSDELDNAYLQKRAALKAEILVLIQDYRFSSRKPPFSSTQLICMAITCHKNYRLSIGQIIRWILKHFWYYGQKAVDKFADAVDGDKYFERFEARDAPDAHMHEVVDDFFDGFRTYSSPIEVASRLDWWPEQVTVDPRACRTTLSDHLTRPMDGTFPFLRLAPELRNKIYELVMVFSESGVEYAEGRLYAVKDLKMGDPRWYDFDMTEQNPLSQSDTGLALQLTCKQIEQEVTPMFHGLNKFYFSSLKYFQGFMSKRPAAASAHVTQIWLSAYPNEIWPKVTTALASHKAFKHLVIDISDKSFMGLDAGERQEIFLRKTKYTNISQIPGFADLAVAASKAEEFELVGECPQIQAFIDAEVQKIKAGGKVTKARMSRQLKRKIKAETGMASGA